MRLKFYLRGLGIGVLVTTFILTVSYNVRANREAEPKQTPSSDSVINYTQPETVKASEKETETVTKEPATTAATTVKATEKATEKVTEKVTQKATTQPTTKAAADSSNKDSVKVVLSDINYAGKASQILADAGVIDNATAFSKYLADNGYASKVVDGTYTLSKGMDYESAAKAITKK